MKIGGMEVSDAIIQNGGKIHETKQTHVKSSFFYCKSARANRQSMQIILVFKQSKHSMQQQQNRKKEGQRGRTFVVGNVQQGNVMNEHM